MVRVAIAVTLAAACASTSPRPPPQPPHAAAEVPPPDNPEETPDDAPDGLGYGNVGSTIPMSGRPHVADPHAKGTLSKDEIRRVVARDRASFAACYEAQLVKQPGLAGRVETTFVIEPDGKVVRATAVGLHPLIEACMIKVLKRLEFSPPTGGSVNVNYPFNFAAIEK